MVNVVCAVPECSNLLPKGQRKFCSDKCRQLIDKRKWRAKKNGEVYILEDKKTNIKAKEPKKKTTAKDGRVSARRGDIYDKFVQDGLVKEVLQDEITRDDAAKILKVSKAQISRFLAAYQEDVELEKAQADWDVPTEAIESLQSISKKYASIKFGNLDSLHADGCVFLKANQKTGNVFVRSENGLGEGILITCQYDEDAKGSNTFGPFPLDFFR